jgi:acetyl esterase/lipase
MKMKLLLTLSIILVTLSGCSGISSNDQEMTLSIDIPYAVTEGVDPNLLSLDVYAPSGAKDLPVILMIHGGGWANGDKANRDVGINKANYFTSLGYIYVSINYRLSPDVQHPAHIEDVASAVSWVLENIGDYGGDPSRVTVMGHSAGAHLAALVSTDESYLAAHGHSLSELSGVILLDGAGYDIPSALNDLYQPGRLTKMYTDAFDTDPAVWADASPVIHVAAGKGIPPTLILYTGREAAVAESDELAGVLKVAGVPVWRYLAEDKTHASINRDIGKSGDEVTEQIRLFLLNQTPYQR